MGRAYKENFKRMADKWKEVGTATASDPTDLVRVVDLGSLSGIGGSNGGPVDTVIGSGVVTVIANDTYMVAVSGSTTVTLPPSPQDGQRHVVKDSEGTAGSVPIVVDGNGYLIDDAATKSLVNDYAAITLTFISSFGRWQLS